MVTAVRADQDAQISWSGCKDSQTSADTWEAGVATGAMSYVSPRATMFGLATVTVTDRAFRPPTGIHKLVE